MSSAAHDHAESTMLSKSFQEAAVAAGQYLILAFSTTLRRLFGLASILYKFH